MENLDTLPIGTVLFNGTYQIKKVLGSGGFGITYLAEDILLNKKVAIKEFFPSIYCKREGDTGKISSASLSSKEMIDKFLEKFIKESQKLAKLSHPNIVRILSAFQENETAYYVMDYLEGGSLQELVNQNGPLKPNEALRYINEIGNALQYLHDKRIAHLDVKPSNVMLGPSGEAILIDFGLAKQYDNGGGQTSTTPMGVSHGYAPIEQYVGGITEFSPTSDIYSLAATLYFLLSGQQPLNATEIIDGNIMFPNSIPPKYQTVIRKAMAVSRNDRHASITEFLRELNNTGNPSVSSQHTQIVAPGNLNSAKTRIIPNVYPSTSHGNGNGGYNSNNAETDQFDIPLKPKKKVNKTFILVAVALLICLCVVGFAIYFVNLSRNELEEKRVEAFLDSLRMASMLQQANDSPAVEAVEEKEESKPKVNLDTYKKTFSEQIVQISDFQHLRSFDALGNMLKRKGYHRTKKGTFVDDSFEFPETVRYEVYYIKSEYYDQFPVESTVRIEEGSNIIYSVDITFCNDYQEEKFFKKMDQNGFYYDSYMGGWTNDDLVVTDEGKRKVRVILAY